MILVTGATGNVGTLLVGELVKGGHQVRAFVKDAAKAKRKLGEGVTLAIGNLDDRSSVEAAVVGVEKIYLLAGGGDVVKWDATVIDAAKRVGVRHVVKHSVLGAQWENITSGRWHRAGEKHLEASGLAWTHVRPGGFFSNALEWAGMIKTQGAIFLPQGSGKSASIDPRDIASVAARVLTTPGHEHKAYDITGPELLGGDDHASAIADAIGKPVRYVDVPESAAKQAMVGRGIPAQVADVLLEFSALVRSGTATMMTDTVKTVTGHPARTFAAWAKENAAAFQ